MNRKQRAARNNKVARLHRQAREKVLDQPKCDHCGEVEDDHVYVPIPEDMVESVKASGLACDILPPKSKMN